MKRYYVRENGHMLEEKVICTLDLISASAAQTQCLGIGLGKLLQGAELLLLQGQLGAGKTTLTQGVAQGMQITDVVSSPTFTLLKEYSSQPSLPSAAPTTRSQVQTLYHFDLYRLDNPDEITQLGFEEYIYHADPHSGVCIVEWAEKADNFWPAERLTICMSVLDETRRALSFAATGAHYRQLLQQFSEENLCDY